MTFACNYLDVSKAQTLKTGLSADTGKLCSFDNVGIVFIGVVLFPVFYFSVMFHVSLRNCAPVFTEGTRKTHSLRVWKTLGAKNMKTFFRACLRRIVLTSCLLFVDTMS